MEIQLWRELLDPYQLAVDELTVKFHHIIEEHRNQGLYSPIESVDGREDRRSGGNPYYLSVCRGHRQSGESYKEPDRYEGKV